MSSEKEFFNHLLKEGKIPAKTDMNQFLQGLHDSKHIPNDDDAELITRFEMQQFCPDILITNYSMLEYMLLRPREQKIWDDTRKWLTMNPENKLLFVIDEAHMYRGSSGGEVALLIRRLFHKLGISRDRVQFILTTASMPNKNQQDVDSVMKFANELTASDTETPFCYLTGEREVIDYLRKVEKEVYNSEDFAYKWADDIVAEMYKEDKKTAQIYTVFSYIAIVISCMGLLGISLFDIRRSYREIAIRKVNGAKPKDLYILLGKNYMLNLLLAFVIAAPVSWIVIYYYTASFVEKASVTFGLFVIPLLIVLILSMLTLYYQINKAAHINPAEVMKSE